MTAESKRAEADEQGGRPKEGPPTKAIAGEENGLEPAGFRPLFRRGDPCVSRGVRRRVSLRVDVRDAAGFAKNRRAFEGGSGAGREKILGIAAKRARLDDARKRVISNIRSFFKLLLPLFLVKSFCIF